MKKIVLLSIISLFIGISTLSAQDKIVKRNKEVIECKVIKVGVKEVEYSQPQYSGDVIFTLAVDRIDRIEFETGKILTLTEQFNNKENYNNQKKNILKLDFFAPFTGNFTIGYERSIDANRSVEVSLGIIGLGVTNERENPAGIFIRAGHKFIIRKEVYDNAYHYTHVLKGFFIRPDITMSYFSMTTYKYTYNPVTGMDKYTSVRGDNFSMALTINIGKQYVFNNSIAFEWFAGFGYGFTSSEDNIGYYFSHTLPGGNDFPFAFQAGMLFGLVY